MSEAKLMKEFWISLSVILVIAVSILFFYLRSRNKYAGPRIKGQKFANIKSNRTAKVKETTGIDTQALKTQLLELDNDIQEFQEVLTQNLSDEYMNGRRRIRNSPTLTRKGGRLSLIA